MITFEVDLNQVKSEFTYSQVVEDAYQYFKSRSNYSGYKKDQDLWEYSSHYLSYIEYIERLKKLFHYAYRKKCPLCLSETELEHVYLTLAHPLGLNKEYPELIKEEKNILPLCISCNKKYKMAYKTKRVSTVNSIYDLNRKIPSVVVPILEPTHVYFKFDGNSDMVFLIGSRIRDTVERFCKDLFEGVDYDSHEIGYTQTDDELIYKGIHRKYFNFSSDRNRDYDFSKMISAKIQFRDLFTLRKDYNYSQNIEKRPIQFRPIEFSHRNLRGFKAESFPLGKNGYTCFIGENGVGKTTLLKAMYFSLSNKVNREFSNSENEYKQSETRVLESKLSLDIESYSSSVVLGKIIEEDNRIKKYVEPDVGDFHHDFYQIPKINSVYIGDQRNSSQSLKSNLNWLYELDNEDFYDFAVQLKSVLDLDDVTLYRRGTNLVADFGDRKVLLSKLSSGYKSIINMAITIRRSISGFSFANSLELFRGANEYNTFVFIDEVDLHLHPKWNNQIVEKLTSIFPGVYFVITTHNPQVLRQCTSESCFKIVKGNGFSKVEEVIDFDGYDIDMILTSSLFDITDPSKTTGLQRNIGESFREYLARVIVHKSILEKKSLSTEMLAIELELAVRDVKNRS